MAYRRFRRTNSTQPRAITVKYAGKCYCCGAYINAGETAMYYPPVNGESKGRIAHYGYTWDAGERVSLTCHAELSKRYAEQAAVNDYAGDGLDARYEDDCAAICGL